MSETPARERLAQAAQAFDVGDYARVRVLVAPLRDAGDPEVAAAAAKLARATSVDRVQLAILLGCLVLLVVIFYRYVLS